MSASPTVREIAGALADRIEELCHELLPLGHREGQEWVDARRAKGGLGDSMKVHLAGQKRGVWAHFAAGQDGDALDLVAYVRGLDKRRAIEWVRNWLGIDGDALPPRPAPVSRPQPPAADHADDARQRLKAAMKIWRKAKSAAGTQVVTYLKARGITIPPPPTLRYAPALKHGLTGLRLPCMVAAVQGIDRAVIGVHRTFLRMDGLGKAPVSNPKMSLGPIAGGAVRLGPTAARLMVGEGIETCLAGVQATGLSAWAALSTSGMKALRLPPDVYEVVILADGDEPGQEAAAVAAERFAREKRSVSIARAPHGQDFADLLIEDPAALEEFAA